MENYFEDNFILKTYQRIEKFKKKTIMQEFINLSKYSIV